MKLRQNSLTIAGQTFLIAACYVQCSHAANFFGTLSTESLLSCWLYAIALEGTVYIFTLACIKWAAYSFAGVSVALNLLLYWQNFTGLKQALGSVLVSISLPFAIAMYSFLNENSLRSSEDIARAAALEADRQARAEKRSQRAAATPKKRKRAAKVTGTILDMEIKTA